MAIASALGATSAYTWLKLPRWAKALRHPTVRGLVVGRSLLYPPNGDATGAVDTAVSLL